MVFYYRHFCAHCLILRAHELVPFTPSTMVDSFRAGSIAASHGFEQVMTDFTRMSGGLKLEAKKEYAEEVVGASQSLPAVFSSGP